MAGEMSVAVRVLAVVSLAVLGNLACCQVALAHRALPPTVVCGSEGSFPDPTDCHYFVNCTGDSSSGYTTTISQCPDGAYYDACSGTCNTSNSQDQCIVECSANNSITSKDPNPAIIFVCRIDSSGQSTITISNCSTDLEALGLCSNAKDCPVDDAGFCRENGIGYHVGENCSIYYYCSSEDATPDVGTCPDGTCFNNSTHSCTAFKCTSEGVFADPLHSMRYYTCTAYGSYYVSQRIDCPSGSHFDISQGGCIWNLAQRFVPVPSSRASPAGSSQIETTASHNSKQRT